MPAAAPKPRRARAPRERTRLDVDERRAQLLALGIRIFSERPYDDVSIDDLAQAAGVSKGLLYHYFPTKRDFYVAAIEQAAEQLLAQTMTSHDLPPEERLRISLDAYLDFVERHGQAYVALMRGGIGADPEVSELLERTRARIIDRIVADVPKRHVTALVRAALRGWIGFVEATASDWLAKRAVPRKKLADLLAGVLLDALALAAGQPVLTG